MTLPITYAEDEPAGEVPAPGETMTLELREAALLQAREAISHALECASFKYCSSIKRDLTAALSAIEAVQGDSVHLASLPSEGVSGSDVPARPTSPAGWWERDDVDAVIACLGDDAAAMWDENEDERAANMDCAASMLTSMLLTHPRFAASPPLPKEQGAVPQWMPIETAPKDGRTLLLGYRTRHGKWRTLRGEWCSAEVIADSWEDEATEGWYETSVEKDDTPNCWWTDPTHWMPLPAPPVADPGQADTQGEKL